MNTRQGMLAIGGGLFLLFLGRIYLFLSLQKNGTDNLAANIQQPLSQDSSEDILSGTTVLDQIPPSTSDIPGDQENTGNELQVSRNIPEKTLPVRILLPPFSDMIERKGIADSLEEQFSLKTTFQQFDSRQSYKTALAYYVNNPERIDIVLLPTERIDSFEGRGAKITFKQSIAPYFHSLFQPFITHESYTLIPYAIDAPVTVSSTDIQLSHPKLGSILSAVSLFSPQQQSTVLLFGGNEDIAHKLSQSQEPFRGYLRILSHLLEQASITERTDALTFLSNNTHRKLEKISQEIELLTQTAPRCAELPTLCLIRYGSAKVGFSHLSDLTQWKKYDLIKDMSIHEFPVSHTQYPLIGWGFLANKHSPNLETAASWIQAYLRLLDTEEVPAQSYMFSAFNKQFQQQRIQQQFEWFQNYQYDWYVVQHTLQHVEGLLQETSLIEFFSMSVSARVLLKELLEYFL